MNCKKIQRLLMTDYLDRELEQGILNSIQQHMDNCIHCRKFEQEIQTARVSFAKTKHIEPPARVWEGICEKITAEQRSLQSGSLFEHGLERIREFLFIRKPLLATSAIALAIVIFALIFIRMPEKTNGLDIVAEDIGFMADEENKAIDDFGTDIEKYFL
ncbi:MAG: hypothetical protein QME49_09905 [bacterium]|nr:hypothetical protein [bacterium]